MRKLILASLTISSTLAAQSKPRTAPLHRPRRTRPSSLLDQPPFDRANWGVYVVDDGKVLFARNADRFYVPASNTKLVVTAAATVLLPPDYRVTTSVYANGRVDNGVLNGDLVLYGRGDPTWSERCFSVDSLAPGACDSAFTAVDAIADSIRARGLRRVTGKLVGDSSYFDPVLVHPGWNAWDLNWWYAAPVSGLGFHDNRVDFHIAAGAAVDQPPVITWSPELALFTFENRARTVPADSTSTIGDNFFRTPGTWDIWAEGTVALGRKPWIESFALPDPNRYAARALAAALMKKGVSVEGGTASTIDSLTYRSVRGCCAPLVEYRGRPLPDIIFPILNSSQNWFAEMLLKILGRDRGAAGSWSEGLKVERRFLIDSVGVDSTSFASSDASGLAKNNLVTARTLAQVLGFVRKRPGADAFTR